MGVKTLDEKAIFEAASGIESAVARKDYLKQACGGDQVLYHRVATLLRMRDEEPDFLETPPPGLRGAVALTEITEKPGTLVGPYKLIEEIGEGGMGLVFLARQQEPVKRDVALKIIKPGLDSRQVIARFDAERQALALMDHPNIARVLDAGSTESGRPYFVMDLVKGTPITEYCDQERLSTRRRLALFIPVCQAIQHAHQRGIIHRDIKPSNVLVTLDDGAPVPKVIDFGVAKATNRELARETLVTHSTQVIGTPLYMSPEQAALGGLDIDTRSDVYSLGVLLYELLTGTTPFEQERLSEVPYDEMRRIIREEEPPKPSTRISTLGGTRATTEKSGAGSRALVQQVRGELDWIVMKALEKDRTRRYESASDLAKDVGRYLNNEPVQACPPSAVYRLRKFVRRNRGVAAAIAAVALSLGLGTGVATWQAIRATKAERAARQNEDLALQEKKAAQQAAEQEKALRAEAERQRARAEANVRLALDALQEVFSRAAPKTGANASKPSKPAETQPNRADDACFHSTLRFYQHFVDANRALANAGPSVEMVQRRAVAARQDLLRESPHVVGYRRALAEATAGLASLLESTGQASEAEKTYAEALRVQKPLFDSFPMVAEYGDELAQFHDRLTDLLLLAGQNSRADGHRAAAERLRSAARTAAPAKPAAPVPLASLRLVGSASLEGDRLRLTPRAPGRAGAAWTAEKQLVALGFDTVFTFQVSGGGDGCAFVIHNHDPSSLGMGGCALGYADGIPNSLAVEFDSFTNREQDDLVGSHISVQTNGAGTNSAHHASSLGVVRAALDDGKTHTARIRYVPGSLFVFLDGSARPVLTAPVELSATLRMDRGRAWVGFTAGTGGLSQSHDILSWQYYPLVDPLAADSYFRSHPAPARDASSQPVGCSASTAGGPLGCSHSTLQASGEPASLPDNSLFLRKAFAFYHAFAAQNRDDPKSLWEIGRACWRMGEIVAARGDGERSEEAYRTATTIWELLGNTPPPDDGTRPHVAVAYDRRARIHFEQGEYDKAFQYYNRAIQLDLNESSYHDALARALVLCPDPRYRDPVRAVTCALNAVRYDFFVAERWKTLAVVLTNLQIRNPKLEIRDKSQ